MKSFMAFFKKEILESVRSGKLLILGLLFLLFGIMNPAIATLTPWMYDILSDSLAESGMIVTEVAVDALTSWTQFFKNIPMALIVFVLIYGGIFTKEYEHEEQRQRYQCNGRHLLRIVGFVRTGVGERASQTV